MSNHGYTQLITLPTIARGTLIDHVYDNGSPGNTTVQVQNTIVTMTRFITVLLTVKYLSVTKVINLANLAIFTQFAELR